MSFQTGRAYLVTNTVIDSQQMLVGTRPYTVVKPQNYKENEKVVGFCLPQTSD